MSQLVVDEVRNQVKTNGEVFYTISRSTRTSLLMLKDNVVVTGAHLHEVEGGPLPPTPIPTH